MTPAFKTAIEIILRHEGGYIQHPKDPGGETNFGISKRAYPTLNIRDLTKDDVKVLYFSDYWKPMRCDKLPFGVALVLFDFGVNAGSKTAIKALQRAVSVKADGIIGDKTIAAIHDLNPFYVIEKLSSERILYYTGLNTFETFGRGWINRSIETMATAILANYRL